MKIFAWIVLGAIILIILALMYYLIVGNLLFRFVFSKHNVYDRVMQKDIDKKIKEYNIDLCWWKKYKFKKVNTKSFDKLTLSAQFFDSQSPKTVIVVHGFGQSYMEMQQYCKFFLEKKFNILVVDNRAHGDSEGEFMGFGWIERKDILSWIEYINKNYKDQNILLFGLSMGATAVCLVAGESLPNNVSAVISDCAFSNADKEIEYIMEKHKVSFKPIKLHLYSYAKRVYGFDISKVDAIKQVKNTKIPILFIHGKQDNIVPVENLTLLYNETPTNLREQYLVETAGHALSYSVAGVLYEKKICDFLKSRTKLL